MSPELIAAFGRRTISKQISCFCNPDQRCSETEVITYNLTLTMCESAKHMHDALHIILV